MTVNESKRKVHTFHSSVVVLSTVNERNKNDNRMRRKQAELPWTSENKKSKIKAGLPVEPQIIVSLSTCNKSFQFRNSLRYSRS